MMEPQVTYQVEAAPLTAMQGGSEERQARASLYAKMAKVLAGIQRIPKLGFNEHFGYEFATEGDIVDVVRALLSEFGLCMFVSMEGVEKLPVTNAKGGQMTNTVVTLQISICDGDTGVCWISSWRGEAQDNLDKGIPKAVTAAVKYFLLKTFLISTGNPQEDPDSDLELPQAPQRRAPAEPRRNPRAPQPGKTVPPRGGLPTPPAPGAPPPAPAPTGDAPKASNGNGDGKPAAHLAGPTEFYGLAKGKYLGAGKRFQTEADIKAYLEGYKTADGYHWQAALDGLSK